MIRVHDALEEQSLPLNRPRRLGRDVVDDATDAADFVHAVATHLFL